MKSKNKVFLIYIFIVVIILIGCEKNERDYYTGTVENNRINISSQVPGKIEKLYVKEGQEVKKGDLICKIESKDLEIEKNRLKAILEGSKSSLEKIEKGSRAEEIRKIKIQINQQDEVLKSKIDEYNYKFDNYQKIEKLYLEGGVSKQDLEDIKIIKDLSYSAYESARLQSSYLKEQLKLLESGATKEEISISKSQYDSSYWALEAIENKIEQTYIYANSTGIIVSTNYDEGEVVTAYANIMSIDDINNLWVKIYIEEKNLNSINLGQELELKVDYDDKAIIKGKVIYISPRGEFTPKNIESKESKQEIVYETKIEIIEGKENLKSGSLVDIYLGGRDE